MARFRAYSSDSSEDESPLEREVQHKVVAVEVPESDDEVAREDNASSSMDEDELASPPRRNRLGKNALVQNKDGEYRYAHEEADESEEEGPGLSDSEPQPRSRVTDPTMIPWAQQVGVDAQKMLVMQTSLFRMPEEAAALQALDKSARPSHHINLRVSPQALNRKHSRDSDGEGLRVDSRERASFNDDIEFIPHRPSRKYTRVDVSTSVATGAEGAIVDAGLALGRSWRVGWGPGGTLVHLGKLSAPSTPSNISSNSSIVYYTSIPSASTTSDDDMSLSSKLLQHHLSNSPIESDDNGIPYSNPSLDIRFSSFSNLFPLNDESYAASLFRLGHALFDPLDLSFGESTPDVRNRIICLRRKAALSSWLERAVSHTVDAALKSQSSASSTATAFTLLTGNQVEKACEVAMDGGNYKLATLISQAGGDDEFKEDLREQLDIWREQRIDTHIDDNVRRIYALLAGVVNDVVPGSKGTGLVCSDIDVSQGLDWKRTFGLHLWFSESLNTTVSEVYDAYSQLMRESSPARRIAQPVPWYNEQSVRASSASGSPPKWKFPAELPPDGLFALIRLHAEPSCSLSQVLLPLSFAPSPVDYAMPWHLYILLSRCMRARDFDDRGDPGLADGEDREDDVEGHSPSADLLTSSYALQLERFGMIQEALFVLLHIEGSLGREKAIKDLLTRSASKLDEWMVRGIVGSLKIPMTWVHEAKAIHAYNDGRLYEAYQLYYSATAYNASHDIAILELAPDVIIRKDLDLLYDLISRFEDKPVDGWHTRGKLFLDYIHTMKRLAELHTEHDSTATDDAVHATETDDLTRTASRLIGLLPDVLCNRKDVRHTAALAEMVGGLVMVVEKLRPLALSQVRLSCANDATKRKHLRSVTHEKFLRSIVV